MKLVGIGLVAALVAAGTLAGGQVAHASEPEGLEEQVAAIAPEYNYASSPGGNASVEAGAQTTAQITGSSVLAVDDVRTTTVILEAATTPVTSADDFETAAGSGFSVGSRAVAGGGQTVLSLDSAGAPRAYDFVFNFVGSPQPDASGGFYAETTDAGSIHILPPWAKDAKGNPVDTHYTVDGNTLTQHVDHTAATAFPVTADPAWTYDLEYGLSLTTAEKARTLMKKCFNCYFPVPGAPKAFPKQGDFLPLYIDTSVGSPIKHNFWCIFERELYLKGTSGSGLWEFEFSGDWGHPDGMGSTITFTMFKHSKTGANTLHVHANILVDNPMGLSHGLYKNVAYFVWNKFANNLANASNP